MRPLDVMRVPLQGTSLIEASAGTGKTWAITSLFLRLLVERELSVDQVLAVTFTEAATAELRERVRRRLAEILAELDSEEPRDELTRHFRSRGDAGLATTRRCLQRALVDFDLAGISTIHGFCSRMLRENAFESGQPFELEMVTDASALHAEIAADFWARETYAADRALVDYLVSEEKMPGSLEALVKAAISQPDRVILPAFGGQTRPGQLQEAGAAARNTWLSDKSGIETVLKQNLSSLNKNTYDADKVARWLAALDLFLGQDTIQVYDIPEDLANLAQSHLRKRTNKGGTTPEHPFFEQWEHLLAARIELALDFKHRLVAYAREEAPRRKLAAAQQGFDDLLQGLRQALQAPGGEGLAQVVRSRYGAVLVAEFQDTDRSQIQIFLKLFHGHRPLFLIGDPKQSIYSFRGADIHEYLRAKAAAGEQTYTQVINHRSDPKLVEAVNCLYQSVPRPFKSNQIDYVRVWARPGASDKIRYREAPYPPLQFRQAGWVGDAPGSWEQRVLPKRVAEDVRHLLQTVDLERPDGWGRLRPRDVAVLVQTNWQAALVQDALRQVGIPSALRSQQNVFETWEAEALLALLLASADPQAEGRVKAALVSPVLGLTGDELLRLETDEPGWEAWSLRFRDWGELWRKKGVAALFRAVIEGAEGERAPRLGDILALPCGERRLTNLRHLVELLLAAEASQKLGPAGLIAWFDRQRSGEEAPPDAAQLRLESDEHGVKLGTIHKSKGLEYPVVYCPFMWRESGFRGKNRFYELHQEPDRRPALHLRSTLANDPTDKAAREIAQAEAREEKLRLLYVGITRARHLCLLVMADGKQCGDSPLAYLAKSLPQGPEASPGHGLARLAEGSAGTIACAPWPEADAGSAAWQAEVSGQELACRTGVTSVEQAWRNWSFSLLSAGVEPAAPLAPAERDHDELIEPAGGRSAPAAPVAELDPARSRLAGLGGGFSTGHCLHGILERLDFQSAGGQALGDLVDQALRKYKLPPEQWHDPGCLAGRDLLETALAPGLALAGVSPASRLSELPFVFPLSGGPDGEAPPVSGRVFADLFRRWPGEGLPPGYPEQLDRIRARPLRGFMRGYIDLVFEHAGRFYVADYKSNFLGDSLDDYSLPRLQQAMAEHHYPLQYHLYVTALHLFLEQRKPGYRYEAHFGGVFYLFLRGLSPRRESPAGIFRDRPPGELIRALADRLRGAGGEAGR